MAQSQLYTNFEEIKAIGRGAYGKVVKAKSKTDKKHYAVKIVKVGGDVTVERELTALTKLEHKNIVRYFSSWKENYKLTFDDEMASSEESEESLDSNNSTEIVCIQMELCQSTLKTLLEKPLSRYDQYNFSSQMWEGVRYMHSKGIIHRDLKPDNIFINNENCLKIGDFGLSKTFADIKFEKDEGDGSLTSYTVGTSFYIAPEIKENGYKYDEKADIYSLGVIYFEICHGPFKTHMERAKVLEGIRLPTIEMPKNFNKRAYGSLIRELLSHNPQDRPTAAMILSRTSPGVDDIKEFRETNLVSKQTIGIYLHNFTRKESVNEEFLEFYQMNRPPRSNMDYCRVLKNFISKIDELMNDINACYFSVSLFLPIFQDYCNVFTNVCLLNDGLGNVYAIPQDRRLCYAYYLRHSQFIPLLKTRYSIDQIYEGSKNETYDTITEWNFDDISVHSSLQSQIVLQLDYLNFWYDKSQLTINVSHKSLYNGIMEYYNISKEDQNILKKWLSYEKINTATLKKRLETKSKILTATIVEICNIFKGQNLEIASRDFKQNIPPIANFIKNLKTAGVLNAFSVKPLMPPYFCSSGITYEIVLNNNRGGSMCLSKGSEYKINEHAGAGFSLNLSNAVIPLLKTNSFYWDLYWSATRQQKQMQNWKIYSNHRSKTSAKTDG